MIISKQEEMINRYIEIDSIRNFELKDYQNVVNLQQQSINSLNNKLEKSNKTKKLLTGLTIGGFSLSLLSILFIFIK